MISASREMKGDSIILSYEQFKDRCDRLKLKYYPYNFMMAVYPTGGINSSEELQYVLTNFTKMSFDQEGKLTLLDMIMLIILLVGMEKYVCGYKKNKDQIFQEKQKPII